MTEELRQKYDKLQDFLLAAGKVIVAFSGGVDSSFLLKTAYDLLGANATGILGVSALASADERQRALRVAAEIGCRIIRCEMDPFSWPEFIRNSPDRCYVCKKRIYGAFLAAVSAEESAMLLDGTNFDDLQEDRPGLQAVRELGVRTPLADAALGKKEIRQLSRELGLSTWQQFSSSCLATRIPFHEALTERNIEFVERSENFLRALGFDGCRVRLRGDAVSLEIVESCFVKIIDKTTRKDVESYFGAQGVQRVFLDLFGRPDIFI